MKFMQDLLEMGMEDDAVDIHADMMNGGDDGEGDEDRSKSYFDDEHAKEEAAKFVERARELLHFNKKEGDKDEIYTTAKKFAADYAAAINDEIEKFKYSSDSDKEEGI